MTSLIRRFALVICILAFSVQASAEVVLLSQSRSVFGYAEASGADFWPVVVSDSDSLAAPDFGLFEEEISLEVDAIEGYSAVSATQYSEIQTGYFSIHGSSTAVDIWSYCVDVSCGHGSGIVHSDFEVLFEVSTPTPFSLIGTLAATYDSIYGVVEGNHIASLQLDRDGGPYLSFDIDTNGEITVNESGLLEPGIYTLNVKVSSRAISWSGGRGHSSFDIDFFLETPVATDEMAWGQVKAIFR